jgi:DNA-binding NtrC family response regulator
MAEQSKGNILIADDEKTFGEGLADALRREGYECKTVTDGRAVAAELHTNSQYDLLISDIRMPGNPGDDALPRHLPEVIEGLPVILVTAFFDPATAIRTADTAVIACLPKPVNFPELMSHVRKGVAFSAVFRANKSIEERLTRWHLDAAQLHQLLARRTNLTGLSPESFARDAMRQVIGCLEDMLEMSRAVSTNDHAGIDQPAIAAALKACTDAIDAK